MVVGLEAPRAGEPAAAGLQRLDLDAHLLQQLDLGIDAAGRLVAAVAPDERLALERRRLDLEALEELGEVVRALREPLRVLVVREELPELVLEHGDAARLEPDDRDPLAVPLAQLVEAAPEVALGQVEEAVVVEGPPTADVALGDDDLPAGRLERLDRRDADVRVHVVVERVGEEDDLPPGRVRRPASLPEPLLERERRELGHLALLRHPGSELEGLRKRRRLRDEVDEPRCPRGEPGDLIDQPERVRVTRAEPVLPAMVEELRLVGGHVDVDRAVVRAALAREAEVERLHHLVRLPAVGDDLPVEHLEQETRAAAGRVHLLARRHEGRAHDVYAPGGAALADADTADGRVREVAVVARVAELDLRPPRLVVGAEAEVLVDAVGPDDLARVHLPVGVPDRLELLEGPDEVVAEHLRQELRARLAVAVLPGQRAAELEHEVARVLEPAPELRDAGLRDQVEVPASVDAALAVVAVERALVAVLVGELREAAEVLAEPLGRDGRVLPTLVRVLLAWHERGRAEARLAHLPDVLLAVGVVIQLHPRR